MRRPGGYLVCTSIEGGADESDTFTCGHCNKVVVVPVKARPEDIGGQCSCCMSLVCPGCVGVGTCMPLEARLEAMERRAEYSRLAA